MTPDQREVLKRLTEDYPDEAVGSIIHVTGWLGDSTWVKHSTGWKLRKNVQTVSDPEGRI